MVLLVALLACAPAGASVIETHPFSGVTLYSITETNPRPNNIQIARIDLTDPGIHFELTPPDLNLANGDETVTQTTRQFVDQVHAQIGINTSFFRLDNGGRALPTNNTGLLVSNGLRVSPWDSTGQVAINLTRDKIASIISAPSNRPTGYEFAPNTYPLFNAVSGSHMLVNFGSNVAPADSTVPGDFLNLNPRTAIGLTRDHQLLLLTVDGRQLGFSEGMYLREVGGLMKNYGAWQAINLDGGGSTTMVMDYYGDGSNAQLVNQPVGLGRINSERYVGASLAVFAAPYVVPEPTATWAMLLPILLLSRRNRRLPVRA
jgi:hypothetical protein